MEFTTARKLIQKAHIAELLHQNTQETGPRWERCLFPALLRRPCLPSSVSRIELFPEDTAVLPAHTLAGLLPLLRGWQHVQGIKELKAPRNWICHHWGKLCALATHIVREKCLSVTLQVTRSGWILLQHQQFYWLLHEVSYANFIKLMDLSRGFWRINSAQMRHQVSWWRCRTSSYRVCPKGMQGILKYGQIPCILRTLL